MCPTTKGMDKVKRVKAGGHVCIAPPLGVKLITEVSAMRGSGGDISVTFGEDVTIHLPPEQWARIGAAVAEVAEERAPYSED